MSEWPYSSTISDSCLGFQTGLFLDIKTRCALFLYVRNKMFRISQANVSDMVSDIRKVFRICYDALPTKPWVV